MRRIVRLATTAALCAVLCAGRSAWSDGGEDGPSSDDLLCSLRTFFGSTTRTSWAAMLDADWTDWWFANRTAILQTSYRAGPVSDGAPAVEDPAARARAREALLAALRSKDTLVVSEAALALGWAGDARDTAVLAALVGDEKAAWRTRRLAAIGLGLLTTGSADEDRAARTALLAAVGKSRGGTDDHAFFWSNCAYALALRGDVSAVPELSSLRAASLSAKTTATSIDPEVLGAICYAEACLAGPVALPEIEDHLRGHTGATGGSSDTSWVATHALERVGGDEALALLRGAARDERPLVRATALAALGAVALPADDDTASILRAAIAGDKDALCRQNAAVSLGRSGHASAAAELLTAFEHGRTEDRTFYALGLGLSARARPDAKVSEMLARALSSTSNDEERAAIAVACGLARVQIVRPQLALLATKGRGAMSGAHAAFALGLTGAGKEELAALHATVAQSVDPLARREAALALALLHDRSVVDELRKIASSRGSDSDRASAVMCLGRVGGDADIDLVVGLLADKDASKQFRPCVAHALGWLLDRRERAPLARICAATKWWKKPLYDTLYDLQHLID